MRIDDLGACIYCAFIAHASMRDKCVRFHSQRSPLLRLFEIYRGRKGEENGAFTHEINDP